MAYIGRAPQYGAFYTQTITANSVDDTFTLDYAVASAASILVSVGGVIQQPGSAYTISSGGTQIIFTEVPDSSLNVFITFLGEKYAIATISDDSITTAKIQDGAITSEKIANGTVIAADILDSTITSAKLVDYTVESTKMANTGVTADTYGGSSQIPVITIDGAGRITSAANVTLSVTSVAGATGDISNAQILAGFTTAVEPGDTGNVLTSDGTNWVSTAPAGGGGSGLFNTSISAASGVAVGITTANVYAAASTSDKRYIIHSIHVTNIDGTATGSVTAHILGSTYSDITLANTIPVPANTAVELLKKPKVLQPNDYIRIEANVNSVLHATATIEEVEGTDLFGAGVDITSADTYQDLHTATGNSVLESILLSNDDTANDVKVTVVWTDGSDTIQGYYSYELIVPTGATVEVLEQPKYLASGYKVRVKSNQANRVEAVIAGKVIT